MGGIVLPDYESGIGVFFELLDLDFTGAWENTAEFLAMGAEKLESDGEYSLTCERDLF